MYVYCKTHVFIFSFKAYEDYEKNEIEKKRKKLFYF